MAIAQQDLEKLLQESFPHSYISVKDTVGDGDHYDVSIASAQFKGKSLMEQHKMVHKALGSMLKETLHAIRIKTVVNEKESR